MVAAVVIGLIWCCNCNWPNLYQQIAFLSCFAKQASSVAQQTFKEEIRNSRSTNEGIILLHCQVQLAHQSFFHEWMIGHPLHLFITAEKAKKAWTAWQLRSLRWCNIQANVPDSQTSITDLIPNFFTLNCHLKEHYSERFYMSH